MVSDDTILAKLENIEKRLEALENGSKIISEERTEVADECELENEIMEERNSTSITRKRIPVCDYCGKQLKDFSICQRCKKKLCSKCSIDYKNQIICKQDLQSIFPISRDGFKVMLMIANNISNEDHMRVLSGIPKKSINEIIQFLKGGFIEASLFGRKTLTAMGMEALGCYCQVLGGTPDMTALDEAIKQHVLRQ